MKYMKMLHEENNLCAINVSCPGTCLICPIFLVWGVIRPAGNESQPTSSVEGKPATGQ